MKLEKLTIAPEPPSKLKEIEVLFNPTSYSISKSVGWNSPGTTGINSGGSSSGGRYPYSYNPDRQTRIARQGSSDQFLSRHPGAMYKDVQVPGEARMPGAARPGSSNQQNVMS